jgi:hypothetical protein
MSVWAVVFLAACPADDGAPGSGTSGSTSATAGPIDDPEAFCAQFTEAQRCEYIDEAARVFCAWVTVTPVTIVAAACELGEQIGSCLAVTGATTAAGCIPPPGCDGEPWFREVDGEVRVTLQCGGSPPVGYEVCTYVEPGVFEPAECACVCDAGSGSSSSE